VKLLQVSYEGGRVYCRKNRDRIQTVLFFFCLLSLLKYKIQSTIIIIMINSMGAYVYTKSVKEKTQIQHFKIVFVVCCCSRINA